MAVNLRALRERARESEGREAFEILERVPLGRIGVGVRLGAAGKTRYFVEVVLNPSPDRPSVRPGLWGKAGSAAARLRAHGYSLRAEDDGCLTCERDVEAKGILREIADVRGWLRDVRLSRDGRTAGRETQG